MGQLRILLGDPTLLFPPAASGRPSFSSLASNGPGAAAAAAVELATEVAAASSPLKLQVTGAHFRLNRLHRLQNTAPGGDHTVGILTYKQ